MTKAKIGFIGGSGLYKIDGLKRKKRVKVKTPFGPPSDDFVTGVFSGREVVFLPRHGRGHVILPSELNHRANIYAMKRLGVTHIISISAVGSLKEEIKPLDIVIPDQMVDRSSHGKGATFFGNGIVAHAGFADPVCPELGLALYEAAKSAGATVHKGGTYLNMEGPLFSTRAESNLYRNWGMDIIGMTNLPEAKLAREAEICYATAAMITDYDCWYVSAQTVTVDMIMRNLVKNEETAKDFIKKVIPMVSGKRGCVCASGLRDAIVTDPNRIPAKTRKKLDIIIGKYID